MKRVVIRRRQALRDLEDIFLYIARGSLPSARRFRQAAERTFTRLADQTGSGTRVDFDNAALAELCVSTVTRFKSYLIYYLLKPDRIEVIRVLHSARGDIDELLSDSLDPN